MSVSSNTEFRFCAQEQIEVAKTYQYQLTGRGQKDLSIINLMEIDERNKTLCFVNCFCMDDFDFIIPDLCSFIANKAPQWDFSCIASFLNEVDGSEIRYRITYKNGKFNVKYHNDTEE